VWKWWWRSLIRAILLGTRNVIRRQGEERKYTGCVRLCRILFGKLTPCLQLYSPANFDKWELFCDTPGLRLSSSKKFLLLLSVCAFSRLAADGCRTVNMVRDSGGRSGAV
jgi:hypothetical protein